LDDQPNDSTPHCPLLPIDSAPYWALDSIHIENLNEFFSTAQSTGDFQIALSPSHENCRLTGRVIDPCPTCAVTWK
jgi:hypothetical protein